MGRYLGDRKTAFDVTAKNELMGFQERLHLTRSAAAAATAFCF
jgi:hypothetical protein